MNEQLKKAIETAAGVSIWTTYGYEFVTKDKHLASKAKLLRVIELQAKQVRTLYGLAEDKTTPSGQDILECFDAELIAALEEK